MQMIREGIRIHEEFSKMEYIRLFYKPVKTVKKLMSRKFSEVVEMLLGFMGVAIILINSTSTVYTIYGRIQKFTVLFLFLILAKAIVGYIIGYFGFYLYTAAIAHFANKNEHFDLVDKVRTAFAWGIVPLAIFTIVFSITSNMNPDLYSFGMKFSDIQTHILLLAFLLVPLSVRNIICCLKGAIEKTYIRSMTVIIEGTIGFVGILLAVYLFWMGISALIILISPIIK